MLTSIPDAMEVGGKVGSARVSVKMSLETVQHASSRGVTRRACVRVREWV